MRAPLENLLLRIVSLVLAVTLWLVIAGDRSSELAVTAPLEFRNFPADLELTGETPRAVEVWIRASPGIMQRLDTRDIHAQVDLAGAKAGKRVVHLTGTAIRVPFGVDVVKIIPSSFPVVLDRTGQKVLPVRPALSGRPADGYAVESVASQPDSVTVKGPEEVLRRMESVSTEPLSVEGAQIKVTGDASVALSDPAVQLLGDPRVRVVVAVKPLATPGPEKGK